MSEERKCTVLRKVLVDAHVEAEFPLRWRRFDDPEDLAKWLNEQCKEFVDFLRDHRSQDWIQLTVVRDENDLCSVCREAWEPWTENGETWCAHCGAVLESKPMGNRPDGTCVVERTGREIAARMLQEHGIDIDDDSAKSLGLEG